MLNKIYVRLLRTQVPTHMFFVLQVLKEHFRQSNVADLQNGLWTTLSNNDAFSILNVKQMFVARVSRSFTCKYLVDEKQADFISLTLLTRHLMKKKQFNG